jgi:hypothetical protein
MLILLKKPRCNPYQVTYWGAHCLARLQVIPSPQSQSQSVPKQQCTPRKLCERCLFNRCLFYILHVIFYIVYCYILFISHCIFDQLLHHTAGTARHVTQYTTCTQNTHNRHTKKCSHACLPHVASTIPHLKMRQSLSVILLRGLSLQCMSTCTAHTTHDLLAPVFATHLPITQPHLHATPVLHHMGKPHV